MLERKRTLVKGNWSTNFLKGTANEARKAKSATGSPSCGQARALRRRSSARAGRYNWYLEMYRATAAGTSPLMLWPVCSRCRISDEEMGEFTDRSQCTRAPGGTVL